MADEKRKSKRVRDNFSILCRIFRKTELEGNVSRIIDISKHGVAFYTNNAIKRDDILQMTFRTPPDFKEKIEIFGRVLESKQETETNFKARVAFINMDSTAESILGNIINRVSK